jgi:hypothetical protein
VYLNVIDPVGSLTSLDLGAIECWRLELIAFPGNLVEAPARKNMLGLALRYITLGGYASQIVAGFDTDSDTEAEKVAAVGLPAQNREGNVERVKEAMKVFINGTSPSDYTDLAFKAVRLVHLYHDLIAALFGKAASGLATIEIPLVGQFEDEKKVFRYALTTHRNQPWLTVEAVSDPALGLGKPPGIAGPPPPVSKGGRHATATKGKGKAPSAPPPAGQEPETLGPPSASALLPPLQ